MRLKIGNMAWLFQQLDKLKVAKGVGSFEASWKAMRPCDKKRFLRAVQYARAVLLPLKKLDVSAEIVSDDGEDNAPSTP